MSPYQDNLLRFALAYVEEAGSDWEDTVIKKAGSPLMLVSLEGCTCLRTQRSGLGYDIMEFETPKKDKMLLILDRMSGHWVSVT